MAPPFVPVRTERTCLTAVFAHPQYKCGIPVRQRKEKVVRFAMLAKRTSTGASSRLNLCVYKKMFATEAKLPFEFAQQTLLFW